MHLPFDQGESAADAMVSSGKVGELIQAIDFASGRDLLAARATNAETRDGEMMPLAVVIESAFSGCCLTVVSGGPLLNPDSGRGWRTRGGSCGGASGDEEECETCEGGIDEVGFHGFEVSDWFL